MAQILPRFCPRCGAPTVAGQPICARCGVDMVARLDDPNVQTIQGEEPATVSLRVPGTSAPPAGSPETAYQPMFTAPKKRRFNRTGCLLVCLLLLLLIAGSYIGVGFLGYHFPGFGGNSSQPSITTMPINTIITYAGIDITILNAQQSESFIDDPNTSTTGMVRLHLQEQNKTGILVSWVYANMARLIVHEKNSIAPAYVQAKIGVAPGVTQTSFVDFAVANDIKISQMILRLGAANEAQMDIPLIGKADLSQYAPKTTSLNDQMSYLGLNWTLTQAITSYSIDGQQASKGMRFITITLSVNNTLAQEAITGSPYDYIRLKSGNITAVPKASTLPVSFEMGVMGKTGTVAFLVPQDSTAFTLLLLSQNQSGFDQASTNFQLS